MITCQPNSCGAAKGQPCSMLSYEWKIGCKVARLEPRGAGTEFPGLREWMCCSKTWTDSMGRNPVMGNGVHVPTRVGLRRLPSLLLSCDLVAGFQGCSMLSVLKAKVLITQPSRRQPQLESWLFCPFWPALLLVCEQPVLAPTPEHMWPRVIWSRGSFRHD